MGVDHVIVSKQKGMTPHDIQGLGELKGFVDKHSGSSEGSPNKRQKLDV